MKVLVIGNGGREHALCRALASESEVAQVFCSPGNAGIALEDKCVIEHEVISPELASTREIDLVVIGPEAPLVAGLADMFQAASIPVIGPCAEAAQLEGSKVFAKEFMFKAGIPTASYRRCNSAEQAHRTIDEMSDRLVVKADGLAAGKGVFLCAGHDEAHGAVTRIMEDRYFGDAGNEVLLEEFLEGDEASIIVLTDGKEYFLFPPARDHKRIGEGDTGPNTGGMGVIAPYPGVDAAMLRRIETEIIRPTIDTIHLKGWNYRGFLFFGVMITERGPYVLEYNVRFGDPEAQALLPLLSGKLSTLLHLTATGTLAYAVAESNAAILPRSSCTVVAAAPGYPDEYRKNLVISDIAAADELSPCYSGVRIREHDLVTDGGRVLSVTGTGLTLAEARERAYTRIAAISFPGMYYRRDIGGEPILDGILEESDRFLPQLTKRGGLVPVVVQDVRTNEVLMVGYANAEALRHTCRTGKATFYSTSRKALWTKGETSGNRLELVEMRVDCDQDSVLYRVALHGTGVCHTTNLSGNPRYSCFYRKVIHRDDSDRSVLKTLDGMQ